MWVMLVHSATSTDVVTAGTSSTALKLKKWYVVGHYDTEH